MKKYLLVFLSMALVCLASAPSIAALERIRIGPTMVDPQTPEAKKTIDDLIEKLIAVSNRLNGNSFELLGAAAAAQSEYSLTLVASLTKDSPAIVINLKRSKDEAQSPSYSWMGMPTPELPSLLARAVFLLWKSIPGFPAQGSAEPPRYVDELPAAFVSPYAYPCSLAAEKGGRSWPRS